MIINSEYNIAQDVQLIDKKIKELIVAYEKYFSGEEKREPVKPRKELDNIVKKYQGKPINNTMYKFQYTNLVAKLTTYKQNWDKICQKIEDGTFVRHKNRINKKSDIDRNKTNEPNEETILYNSYLKARAECGIKDTIEKEHFIKNLIIQKEQIVAKLGCDVNFKVVIEDGKPKIKANKKAA